MGFKSYALGVFERLLVKSNIAPHMFHSLLQLLQYLIKVMTSTPNLTVGFLLN